MRLRIGHGVDAHAFAANRELWLGGVCVPHSRGLAGHSDADVLIHALGDALLGALGLGDLGRHFPDGDPSLRGIASGIILARIMELVRREGYRVVNVDTVVIAQEPRLAPHVAAMQAALASILGIPAGAVGVKATTTEHLGFTGRGEGIAATAVVLLAGDDDSFSGPARPER